MNLRIILVEILVSALSFPGTVSKPTNEKIGTLPGGLFGVYRLGNIEDNKCMSSLAFRDKDISNYLRYDCVEDPSAVFRENFAIIDDIVYSDRPNIVVIWKNDKCVERDLTKRPIREKAVDDEYCQKVQEAIHDRKSIELIEKEEDESEKRGVFVVFDWLWDAFTRVLEFLGFKSDNIRSGTYIKKGIADLTTGAVLPGIPSPKGLVGLLNVVTTPLLIYEKFFGKNPVINLNPEVKITAIAIDQ